LNTEHFKAIFYTRILRSNLHPIQSFIQLSLTSTKLCHIKNDHLENFYISLEGPLCRLYSQVWINGHWYMHWCTTSAVCCSW